MNTLLRGGNPITFWRYSVFRTGLPAAFAAAGLLLFALPGSVGSAAAASAPLPNLMAAVGDSITRAYDVDASCVLSDCPEESWSTGIAPAVDSEYQRILAANSAISGKEVNDASSGAKMVDLDDQVRAAASQGVQYLTVEMGANDLCVSSVSDMTPTSAFESEFRTALTDFTTADPSAHIFVASIPNIYQLWQVEESNATAEAEWNILGICPDMLSSSANGAQRAQIVAQEHADNQALATVCAEFSQCKFDNDAVYNVAFTTSDVSNVDYFHPSLAGQALLAATAWSAGYWPGTK